MVFYFHANKTHFYKKGFALCLVLKVRVFGTRKWLLGDSSQSVFEAKGIVRKEEGDGIEKGKKAILCFHSRGQHLCKFIGTKESVYTRKEFNSHRTGLGHKNGRRFIVLGHKYGRHDVM